MNARSYQEPVLVKSVPTKIIVAIAICLLLGCADGGSASNYTRIGDGLIRTDDPERGVSCYHRTATNVGLSCVYTGVGKEQP